MKTNKGKTKKPVFLAIICSRCVLKWSLRESEIVQMHQEFEVGWVWDILNAGTVLKDIS